MSYKGPTDYIDVAQRIVEFRTQHPEGSLQQVKYELVETAGKTFLIYTAAAYRTPDDQRPGIGTAWEPVPGATSFTRDSEMQNAETAAWGRAIVAALAADTKKGVASADEVRNRQPEPPDPLQMAKDRLAAACRTAGVAPQTVIDWAITPAGPGGGVALNVCTDPKVFDALAKRVQDGGFAEPTPDEAKAAVQGELGGTEVPS